MHEFGKARDNGFEFLARLRIAGEKNNTLARRDHAGGAGHFAVDKHGTFFRERRNLPLLDRHRI